MAGSTPLVVEQKNKGLQELARAQTQAGSIGVVALGLIGDAALGSTADATIGLIGDATPAPTRNIEIADAPSGGPSPGEAQAQNQKPKFTCEQRSNLFILLNCFRLARK